MARRRSPGPARLTPPTKPRRWCDGVRTRGRPTRRAGSKARTPRSRGSISCWPPHRRPTRAVACGSTAWSLSGIAIACARPPTRAPRCAPMRRCRRTPRRPTPTRCSTCVGQERRAPPTDGSWRRARTKWVPSCEPTRATALFYASTELEDFKTAYATIDQLVNDQPIWRTYSDSPSRSGNPDRAFAEVTAANARYYGNQLADAWARITKIAAAAPANGAARLALYQIARARGWPRRAQAEGEIAASLDPDAVGSKIALAEIAIANHRFAEAQRMVRDLLASYPEDLHVRQLARDLEADLGWLFEFEAKPSRFRGRRRERLGPGAEPAGQAHQPADRRQLEALRAHRLRQRPSARGLRRSGARERRRGLAAPDLSATLYASDNWGTLTKPGGGATLDWSATDQIHRLVRRRALHVGHAAARGAARHHRGRTFVQTDLSVGQVAQPVGQVRLSAVHRRQPALQPAASPTRRSSSICRTSTSPGPERSTPRITTARRRPTSTPTATSPWLAACWRSRRSGGATTTASCRRCW